MSDPDPNTEAHRIAAQAGPEDQPASPEMEAAWETWSKQVKRVDQRGMELLRAAFEAGWSAGASAGVSQIGRIGGQRGGASRAKILSPERRQEIAKKAAQARWKDKS